MTRVAAPRRPVAPNDAMLLFKKQFLDAIRQGTKTQTIRLWPYRRMRAGQRSYIPGAGYIHILRVDAVELDELTDEDAVPDGFETADSLREAVRSLYADQFTSGYQAFRIVFALLPIDEQARIAAERKAKQGR